MSQICMQHFGHWYRRNTLLISIYSIIFSMPAAIILALVTKEVYSSLFIGIVIGGLFYGNIFQQGFSFEKSVLHIFEDGLVGVLSDPYNVGILIFLVVLGIMVSMMNKAGGSAAFGQWAGRHIKTRIGAQLSAVLLGMLIFIDDYFNCLTVGSVMRPVTDKHQVSRAKLAYIIDATAAPICIIAPISSWAAAVTGFVEGEDGFAVFMNAIPYNYYALLTIIAMLTMVLFKIDFGAMARVNNTIQDYFDAFGKDVIHTHFVDGKPTGHLAWSDGTRDLKQDLLDLEANGYDGYLSLESANSRYYEKPWVAEETTLKAFEKLGKED